MQNGARVGTERQPEECNIRHTNRERVRCVVANDYFRINRSVSRHTAIIHVKSDPGDAKKNTVTYVRA